MWLKTQKGELVNMDRVAIVDVYTFQYLNPPTCAVRADIQVTSSEDMAISAILFESSDKWYCHEFVKWLYEQLAAGARVADVAEYLEAFESDDV